MEGRKKNREREREEIKKKKKGRKESQEEIGGRMAVCNDGGGMENERGRGKREKRLVATVEASGRWVVGVAIIARVVEGRMKLFLELWGVLERKYLNFKFSWWVNQLFKCI